MSGPELAGARYTLGEAAAEIGVERRTAKHWASLFPIKSARGAQGERLLSSADVDLLSGVRVLVLRQGHLMRDIREFASGRGAEHLREVGRAACEAVEASHQEASRTDCIRT